MEPDDKIFEIGLSTANKIRTRIAEVKIPRNDAAKCLPLIYFFVRSYKSYVALHLLWANGYVEDSYTLARTIYELCLQADFMAGDLENRSNQFADSTFATMLEYHRRLSPTHAELGEAMAEEIAQRWKEFRTSKGLPEAPPKYQANWWGGGGVRKLVEALNLPVGDEYETIYFMLSDHVHSSVSLVHRYATTSDDDSVTLNFDPARSHELTVPYSASGWLLRIGGRVSDAMNLGLGKELEQAAVELNSVARPGLAGEKTPG